MKTSVFALTFNLILVNGFAPAAQQQSRQGMALQATSNDNNNNNNAATAAAFLLGAAIMSAPLMAANAETSLDFSLPTYDTKMGTFAETEARLYDKREMTDPGANEREKQEESMRKAEEARKERIAREKAAQKERDEEAKRRAIEKKARDAERLKNIWG